MDRLVLARRYALRNLSGDLPLPVSATYSHHQTSPLPQLNCRPQVETPKGLLPIVAKLLEKKPSRRYRSTAKAREILKLGVPKHGALPDLTSKFSFDDSFNGDNFLDSVTLLRWKAGRSRTLSFKRTQFSWSSAGPRKPSCVWRSRRASGPYVRSHYEGDAGAESKLANWLREQMETSGDMDTMSDTK